MPSSLQITATLLLLLGAEAFLNQKPKNEKDESKKERGMRSPQYKGCPEDDRFPEDCEILMPPYPACKTAKVFEWIAYAIGSGGPHCCREDLSECRCPVKDSEQFAMAIEYGCQEIGTCKIAYDSIMATELLKSELESLSSEFPELE